MALAEHLVGRAEELGSVDRLLAHLDEGRRRRSSWSGSRESARRDYYRNSPLVPTLAGTSCFRDGWGARARLTVLDLRRRARRVRPGPRTPPPGGTRADVRASSRTSSRRWPRSRAAAKSRFSTSVTGFTARCARCSNGSRDEAGGARPRRSPLGGSGVGRVARCASSSTARGTDLVAIAVRPRQVRARSSAALERANRTTTLIRVEFGRSHARSWHASWSGDVAAATSRCTRIVEVIRSTSSNSPERKPWRSWRRKTMRPYCAGVDVPRRVATALARGARSACRPRRACSRGRRGRW